MKFRRLACAALVAAAALTGCADKTAAPEVPPTPSSPSALPTPVQLGAEGMDVRYLDEDGQIRTLRVEDFPR